MDHAPKYFALENTLKFCRQNPGVAVITGGSPGSREPNSSLVQYKLHDCNDLIYLQDQLDCVPSSIVNGVQYFRDTSRVAVAKEKLRKSTTKPTNLKQVGQMVQGLGLKLALRKPVFRREIHKKRRDMAFNMMGELKKGVWLVRFVQTSGRRADHCVLVNANKGII